jgi:hypothetical protein
VEDIQESLGNGDIRDKYRNKHSDDDTEVVKKKKIALSDALFDVNTPPSPVASSISNIIGQSDARIDSQKT